ncbi:DNA polymerase [Crocinitomicaceae bacterium]|nr:DNA polymerase [Crocinitomicaceae bacterium]
MNFHNYASGQNYKVVLQLSAHDFKYSYKELYLSMFKDMTNFLVVSFNTEKTTAGKEQALSKTKKGSLIIITDPVLYKHLTHKKTLPKLNGAICSVNGYFYQYLAYNQNALYMQKALIKLEDSVPHIERFISTGAWEPVVTGRKKFYPKTDAEVKKAFKYLLKQKILGADIETTSLKFYEAELVSIAFGSSETTGITFHVRKCQFEKYLKSFFKKFKGKIVWHGGSYDTKVLAYLYFDGDARELFRTYEDTSIIHYLCTNSPERFERDLGTLAAPLCGEYKLTKKEITNMMDVDPDKVCDYNLDDSRGTLWLYHQWLPKLETVELYETYKKWQWMLVQVELNGMPFDEKVNVEVTAEIEKRVKRALGDLMRLSAVRETMYILRMKKVDKYNAEHVKQKTEDDFELEFNPNSGPQVAILLYDVLGLTCPQKTAKGLPSTSTKTMAKLVNQLKDPGEDKDHDLARKIMDSIDEFSKASKIISTFIKALNNNSVDHGDHKTLHGTFNLAKVVSGRLSSSAPNLTNLPSGSVYGKLFKSIIRARKGWSFGGADYASLEDRINAILTNDKNKVKVYTDGYDGHSLRAYGFFKHLMPDIEDTVQSINSISDKYDWLRSKSKGPTFTLTYDGTWVSLHKDSGFPVDEAKRIEKAWHEMYAEADAYVAARLEEAADKGYLEVAYGLRVHCYGITRALLNSRNTPYLIQKYLRTLGNAIGQSYGQLNTDAGYKFLMRVYEAGLQHKVHLIGLIHDALYVHWETSNELTAWVNKNLTECMADVHEHKELNHVIKLSADLDLFVESWATPHTLPHNLLPEDVPTELQKYEDKKKSKE